MGHMACTEPQCLYKGALHLFFYVVIGGIWWCSWLRHYATSRKVVGSISDGVIGFFIDLILPATFWLWG